MIRKQIFGIPLATRASRRGFVVSYWLAVAAALAVLFQFPMPPDVSHWTSFLPLLATLAIASNLPLLLGGFSVGGAVGFYEGEKFRNRSIHPNPAWKAWCWVWGQGWKRVAATEEGRQMVQRFLHAVRPVDERETKLRDEAHHRAMRLQLWITYAAAVAYLLMSAADRELLARFGFVLLELLLVVAMSLPQSLLLWTMPDVDSADEMGMPLEAR
jgi:hypothetical protein